jgi:hypothetical protein
MADEASTTKQAAPPDFAPLPPAPLVAALVSRLANLAEVLS